MPPMGDAGHGGGTDTRQSVPLADAGGRLVVELRDLGGDVVRTIAPPEAMDIMSGLAGH